MRGIIAQSKLTRRESKVDREWLDCQEVNGSVRRKWFVMVCLKIGVYT
jgi:hypothetical protein